jgi:hypothetical protein
MGFKRNGSDLLFYRDPSVKGVERDSLEIEAGMLMQTVSCVCAGMGVCVVFSSFGEDGVASDDGKWALMSFKLEPMKPSYQGNFWTTSQPSGERAWKSGNLPDPNRTGSMPLLQAISTVAGQVKGKGPVDRARLGQLLWAARGRTPHMYFSKPWGMTVPVAHGIQNRTGVAAITPGEGLMQYVNWTNLGPTHSLCKVDSDYKELIGQLNAKYPSHNAFLLLATNEDTGYARWEIGFMLQNMFLQAASLGCVMDAAIDMSGMATHIKGGTIRAVAALNFS